jgi:hypothetical protein
MHRVAWVIVLALLATVPAVGSAEKPLAPIGPPPPPPAFQPAFPGGDANYKAPKADGPVVELLDEGVEAIFPVLINDGGGEPGTITREDRDAFSGVEAARVTPLQKYRSRIPGWNFKIVETPKNAGEFRHLRFAWKKFGGAGVMIQLHDPTKSWNFRFFAGRNVQGWQPAKSVSDKVPGEWEVVTRDLFKEFGEFTITGFALTPFDGTAGLFDHMLLGRTVEDLDKATDAALGKAKPAKAMVKAERDASWDNLMGEDRVKAATALRALLASAPEHVAFVEERLGKLAVDKDQLARVRKLVADLDADSFDVRDAATGALIKLGPPSLDAVRALAKDAPNDEVRYRANLILRKIEGSGAPVSNAGRMARVVRVLERAGNAKARDLLGRMADGEFGFDAAPDAKAALARLKKSP